MPRTRTIFAGWTSRSTMFGISPSLTGIHTILKRNYIFLDPRPGRKDSVTIEIGALIGDEEKFAVFFETINL